MMEATTAIVSATLRVDSAAPKKLRIFMSYGHDAFEDLAIQLDADLRKRGHEVWFDKHELLPGTQWEYEIEKGLRWVGEGADSGWVVLLMTPHSVRRPEGYCLNELERAIEGHIPIVPVMVLTVEPPIPICRLQYLDMTDCIPLGQRPASYERKFETLCLALEKQGLMIEGEANRLRRALRPTSYEIDTTYYLPRFTGRKWLIRAFDEWVADPKGPQVFWITGSLGTGKSTLAAWLCGHRSAVKAFHVCGYFDQPKSDYREAVRSIAWQLSTQIPSYTERLNAIGEIEMLCRDPDVDLLDRLIVQPMHGLPAPESPVVVLIDALDEAASGNVNALAELLGREITRLPAWMRVALTSAPDPKVTVPLQAWSPVEIVCETKENVEDVREYVEKYIAHLSPDGVIDPPVLDRLLKASEYNWLYIDWVRRALEQGQLTFQTVDAFPQGLGGACHHEFLRRFPQKDQYERLPRPFLSVMAVAREPLRTAEYARVLGCPESEIKDVVRDLAGLVAVRDGRVRPFHHALVGWLTDETKSGEHSASVSDGHRCLADDGWTQFQRGPESMQPYATAHLPWHLSESGELEKLGRCVTDALFIAGRLAADNLYELAPYWKPIAPFRLRQLCSDSHVALRLRVDDTLRHSAALGTGQLFQQAGLYEDAIGYFNKALHLSRRMKDACASGQAELNIGWCLRHVDAFERAIGHASAAMKCFREGGSREGRARALSVRGICHWHLRDDLAALRDLRDAASLYEDCGDDRSRAEALNHLGIVRRSLGMYDEALACLRESKELSTRFKDDKGLGKCLNSLGTAYWWKGDPELAIELYRQADRTNEDVNQPYVLGLTANNLGYLYLEKGLHRQAYEAFRRARSIRRQLGIVSYEMMDVSGMALASHLMQRFDEAKDLSSVAVQTLRQFSAVEDLERAYFNHYVIMAGGTRQEREEGANALERALGLVTARMQKIGDEMVLARFREVPLVKAIAEAAGTTQLRAKSLSTPDEKQPAVGGHASAKKRRHSAGPVPVRKTVSRHHHNQ